MEPPAGTLGDITHSFPMSASSKPVEMDESPDPATLFTTKETDPSLLLTEVTVTSSEPVTDNSVPCVPTTVASGIV